MTIRKEILFLLAIYFNSNQILAMTPDTIKDDTELLCSSREMSHKRVLLIGDSISKCYSNYVCNYLPKSITVFHNKTNANDTNSGLRRIKLWTGYNKWDLIYFNFGLHDIIRQGKDKSNCSTFNCKPNQTSIKKYSDNLKSLLNTLKKSSSKVIFATTTPFLPDVKDKFWIPEDVPLYNSIALKVMYDNKIKVDDLYSLVLNDLPKFQIKNDVHFKPDGCQLLARKVAETVLEAVSAN
jgi:lysophospholipase L1-like esterase